MFSCESSASEEPRWWAWRGGKYGVRFAKRGGLEAGERLARQGGEE